MSEHQEIIHPRPQLTRTNWFDLTGPWGFAYDDDGCGFDQHWEQRTDVYTRTIQVPFPPESSASGIGDKSFHPVVWYRRTFCLPPGFEGKRWLLHLGAVDYVAHIWINGRLVATHEGGQTPIQADITTALLEKDGVEQVLIVRAEDAPKDLTQPRGKQDWQETPHDIWYHRTTGIWQPVWIEPVSPTHISWIRWTPDLGRGLLDFSIGLERVCKGPLGIRLQLKRQDIELANDFYTVRGTELRRQIAFDPAAIIHGRHLLWTPETPNLIDVKLTVVQKEQDQVIDEVHSYFGLRSVAVKDGHFLLNGLPYYLRLVLEQGYWPETHLATPGFEALRREVELAKELGFNGLRIHQRVADPRFLYLCDRQGLLVWGEMANAYIFSPLAIERLTREWLEVIRRDRNHPCIVAWVPFNESWGVPNVAHDAAQRNYVEALYHLTRALDPTRPTVGNDGWDNFVSDIFGVHDYSFDGRTLQERYGSSAAVEKTLQETQPGYHALLLPGYRREGEPIMLTEFGGITYQVENTDGGFGYSRVHSSEEFLKKYQELLTAVLNSPAIAGFCYTQLTDIEQETNGLLTANREPKLNIEAVRAITSRASIAVPGDLVAQVQQAHSITSFTSTSAQASSGSLETSSHENGSKEHPTI